MKGALPLRDDLPVAEDPIAGGKFARWTQTWAAWFGSVAKCLFAWNVSLTGTKTHDFGSINAHTEASTTVTVTGARTDDTPTVLVGVSAQTAGIVYKGAVTADNTVTLYALNTTAAGIDPDSTVFRVTVLQP